MTQPPLNPDALEAASRAIDPEAWEVVDKHRGDSGAERLRASLTSEATAQVSAYLAVALPEVTSVEELDALPAGSVVRDPQGRVWTAYEPWSTGTGFDYHRWMCADGGFVMDKGWFDGLPARVLYRPEVKP